ncbi:hypothetical protein BH09GEM1_BH09GEM1_43980 [soil metagenome]
MVAPAHADRLRLVRAPAYAFLTITLVFQIVDFVLGVMPFHLGQLVWRFATIGSLANNVGNVLLLTFLLLVAVLIYRDRLPLLLIAVFAVLAAITLLVCSGAFALDVVQLSGSVQPQAITRFMTTAGEALVKCLIESVLFAMMATSAYRAWRAEARASVLGRGSEEFLVSRGAAARVP